MLAANRELQITVGTKHLPQINAHKVNAVSEQKSALIGGSISLACSNDHPFCRRARNGSMRTARNAGAAPAAIQTTRSPAPAATSVGGSVALTPNN